MAKREEPKTETIGRYSLVVGGNVLMQDGRVVAVGTPAAVYQELKFWHVQGFWRVLNDPELVAQAAPYLFELVKKLQDLGDEYGLQENRMTEAELKTIGEIEEKLGKKDG